jgi:hypothetical protein
MPDTFERAPFDGAPGKCGLTTASHHGECVEPAETDAFLNSSDRLEMVVRPRKVECRLVVDFAVSLERLKCRSSPAPIFDGGECANFLSSGGVRARTRSGIGSVAASAFARKLVRLALEPFEFLLVLAEFFSFFVGRHADYR